MGYQLSFEDSACAAEVSIVMDDDDDDDDDNDNELFSNKPL